MKKSEVYSWRLSPQRKSALEDHARAEGITMAKLLDRIVGGWLEEQRSDDHEAEQRRMREAAAQAIGKIRGGDPTRAARTSELVSAKLRERHGR
jgi:hypothetical protein